MDRDKLKNAALSGILNNPVFVLVLGMCPTISQSTSVTNALGLGLATAFVLVFSNLFISLLRKVIPDKVRLPAYIVIIATFVTLVQMFISSFLPSLNDSIGAFIPLIVVNCIILGRAEAFASKNDPLSATVDGLSMGVGFVLAIVLLGAIRQTLAAAGFTVFTMTAGGFIVLGFQRDETGNITAILSRKAVQLGCKKSFVDNLREGDVINARVTHLEKFGAFIDIGAGINALIPIDMLSVSRINHPRERLYEGESIRTVLRKREPEKLTFSLKELLGTWQENAANFNPGETVTGTVRSIETYGVFVELAPNLAGLAEPCDFLFEGQRVAVYIKSVLPDKMKIKLVIVEAFEESEPAGELKYFFTGEHMARFDYSPENSAKIISTVFEE